MGMGKKSSPRQQTVTLAAYQAEAERRGFKEVRYEQRRRYIFYSESIIVTHGGFI
jgi:hypothetical protein